MNENHLTVLRAWAMEKSATGVNCPGGKLRSRGMGRGLGLGQGMGPRGIPLGAKMVPLADTNKPDKKKKKKDESEDKKETVSKKAVDEARAALTAFADSRAREADSKLNAKLIDKLARVAKFAADAQNAKTKTEGKQEQAKEIPQLVADETIKGVPKKKPEKVSENEVEYVTKKAYGGFGIPIGAIHGAFREKDHGESRLGSIGRGLVRGGGSDIGSAIGGIVGTAFGSIPGYLLKRPGLSMGGMGLGALIGSILSARSGYRIGRDITKRPNELADEAAASQQSASLKNLLTALKSRPAREVEAGPEGGRKFIYDKPVKLNFPTAEAKQRFLGRGTKQTKKAALAAMGFAVQPPDALKSDPGLPRRDGGKSTRRQDIFNELSGWSLGTE